MPPPVLAAPPAPALHGGPPAMMPPMPYGGVPGFPGAGPAPNAISTSGHPFYPGAPGVPPMLNPSLNYLQNIVSK